jgi:hypothetical protein
MASAPLDPAESRRLRALVRDDRAAAGRALAALPLDAQVEFVCATPVDQRAAILAAFDAPEKVIPALPDAELCFTVKAIGLPDADWILEHATPEQVVAAVDLDAWSGYDLELATLSEWIEAIATTNQPAMLRSFQSLDLELAVLFLRSRIHVVQKPTDDEGFEPPAGSQTLEGQFHLVALNEGDDLAPVITILRALFVEDYWIYFRLMQAVIWELESDALEWALRWRRGRLEDLGFPPWDEAMRIYRFVAPAERAKIDEDARPLDVSQWSLPVWVPGLPATTDSQHRVLRAIAELDDEERRACFYAFTGLANRIAVADRLPLSDIESTPRALEKAARFTSEGLAHVASETGMTDAEVLRSLPLERLFTVGANLDPASARP